MNEESSSLNHSASHNVGGESVDEEFVSLHRSWDTCAQPILAYSHCRCCTESSASSHFRLHCCHHHRQLRCPPNPIHLPIAHIVDISIFSVFCCRLQCRSQFIICHTVSADHIRCELGVGSLGDSVADAIRIAGATFPRTIDHSAAAAVGR
jgi:hypothetical protein